MDYAQMMGDRWDAVMADLSRPRERMPVLNNQPREQLGGHKWHLIWERDGGMCWLCGAFVPKGTGEVDHMIPRSSFAVADLAIADRSDNLRTACQPCNQAKSNFRPLSIRATVGVTPACWAMGITETMIVQVAEVEVNDEYRVELTQLRKVTDYSPDQAEELGELLLRRAEEARVMVTEQAMAARRRILDTALSAEGVL